MLHVHTFNQSLCFRLTSRLCPSVLVLQIVPCINPGHNSELTAVNHGEITVSLKTVGRNQVWEKAQGVKCGNSVPIFSLEGQEDSSEIQSPDELL